MFLGGGNHTAVFAQMPRAACQRWLSFLYIQTTKEVIIGNIFIRTQRSYNTYDM